MSISKAVNTLTLKFEICLTKPQLNVWILGSFDASLVQFSHSVMSDSLQPRGLWHARLFCPSPTPRACSNSLIEWCHTTISSSVVPFSYCLQSFPASGALHAATAKSHQSWPTLCDPIDGRSPGSPVPGILQARTLEWVAISFSNAWKWRVKGKLLSCVQLSANLWTLAYQAPPSMGFSRQEYWSGVPLPSPFARLG